MSASTLTEAEKATGIKYILRFAIFNGMGFGLLAETIIILLAMDFGASDFQLGYLSSIVQFSGIILLFLPGPLAGHRITRVYFITWMTRGLICLFYGLTLLTPSRFSLLIIMVVYTLFCLFRITGIALFRPIQQLLSTSTTIGSLVVQNSIRYDASLIVGKTISFILLSFSLLAALQGYLLLLFLGVIFNSIASLCILKIPSRDRILATTGQNVFTLFLQGLKQRVKRIPLLLQWSTQGNAIAGGFIIVLLNKVAGMPKPIIFLYTMLVLFASALTGICNKPFVDRIPAKPVLIITSSFQVLLMLIWGLIKNGTPWQLIFLLGIFQSIVSGTSGLHTTRTVIRSFPAEDKVGYNAMINFFSGINAFALGLGAGALATLGRSTGTMGDNPYFLIFLTVAVFNVIGLILSCFLKE